MKVQKLSLQQACWVLYLSRFNFTLKHVPGIRMGKVDRLNRRSYSKIGTKNYNETKVDKERVNIKYNRGSSRRTRRSNKGKNKKSKRERQRSSKSSGRNKESRSKEFERK